MVVTRGTIGLAFLATLQLRARSNVTDLWGAGNPMTLRIDQGPKLGSIGLGDHDRVTQAVGHDGSGATMDRRGCGRSISRGSR